MKIEIEVRPLSLSEREAFVREVSGSEKVIPFYQCKGLNICGNGDTRKDALNSWAANLADEITHGKRDIFHNVEVK